MVKCESSGLVAFFNTLLVFYMDYVSLMHAFCIWYSRMVLFNCFHINILFVTVMLHPSLHNLPKNTKLLFDSGGKCDVVAFLYICRIYGYYVFIYCMVLPLGNIYLIDIMDLF